jgi:hypothetical protein
MKKIILLVGILFLNSSYGLGFDPRSDCYLDFDPRSDCRYDPDTISEVAGLLKAKLNVLENNVYDAEDNGYDPFWLTGAIRMIDENDLERAVTGYRMFAMRVADPGFDGTSEENQITLKCKQFGKSGLRSVLDRIEKGLSTLNLSDKTHAIELLDDLGLDISYFSRVKGAPRRRYTIAPEEAS